MSGEPRLPEQAGHGPQVGPGQVGAVLASLHFHTISRQFLIIQPAGYYIILLGVHDLAGVDVGQDVLQAGEESIAAGVPAVSIRRRRGPGQHKVCREKNSLGSC